MIADRYDPTEAPDILNALQHCLVIMAMYHKADLPENAGHLDRCEGPENCGHCIVVRKAYRALGRPV